MNPPRATHPRRPDRSRRRTRRQFVPEPLEHRHLLSVALPGITATIPADGATMLRAPQAFTITLDQSVVEQIDAAFADALSLPPDQVLPTIIAFDLNLDVEIDRVGADGLLTPIAGGAAATPILETLVPTTAPDGTAGTRLVVTLPSDAPPVQPGTYQLEILPNSLLAMAFGSITDPIWYSAPGPIPIAQFTIEGQGPTLAGATDLGTVGAQGQGVWATLDPSDVQSAVALYRFTLPQGGPWQVDAKISANSIGSLLTPALALLGPDGTVLATRDAGTGSLADPLDPELIRNLPAGTYYLGVSTAHNLPGTDAGYDPISGKPGTVGVDQPAGLFELQVSATPVRPSSTVVAFNLEHADPLAPSPTGMDLTFSGPVDVSPLTRPDQLLTALSVVDARGWTWPISAVDYQASDNRLRLVFNEALPAGTYSLVVPSQGGLTDPSGRPVVGPDGNTPRVLATWTVAAPTGPADPNNLGILWPGAVNVNWASGVSRTDALDAGQGISDRFVVICPGIYELQTQVGAGSIDAGIAASDGTSVMEVGSLTGLTYTFFNLGPGVYELRMTAEGSQAASVEWTLKPVALDYEKLAANGVGQSPALTLALVGPVASEPGVSVSTGGTGLSSIGATNTTTTAESAGEATGGVGAGRTGFAAAALPAALLVTPEADLVGLPAADEWHTEAVGPLADGAVAALADVGRGLSAGLRYQASPSGAAPTVGEGDELAGPEATAPGPPSAVGSDLASAAGGPEAASARADAMALARAEGDPMVRIAGWLAGRIPGPAATPREPEIPANDFSTTLLAEAGLPGDPDADTDGTARDPGRATLSQADIGLPVALLVGTALTYRLSQPIRRWWRRHPIAHPTWPRPYGFARAGRPEPQETR